MSNDTNGQSSGLERMEYRERVRGDMTKRVADAEGSRELARTEQRILREARWAARRLRHPEIEKE